MDFFSFEMLRAVFTSPDPGGLLEKILLFFVAWTMVRRKIRGPFEELKNNIKAMRIGMETLIETMKEDSLIFKARIESLEKKVEKLDKDVKILIINTQRRENGNDKSL